MSRPDLVWMPAPGPVAYQVQPSFLAGLLMSIGLAHVWPSSSLFESQMERVPTALPAVRSFSRSLPRLCVSSSQITPVSRSMMGQGLPQVLAWSSQTTCPGEKVLPPPVERLGATSMSPVSLAPYLRASAHARPVDE